MGAGRKPVHKFNTLQVGESAELKGKAKKYPHQFVYQYNKSGKRLKIERDGNRVLVVRVE